MLQSILKKKPNKLHKKKTVRFSNPEPLPRYVDNYLNRKLIRVGKIHESVWETNKQFKK